MRTSTRWCIRQTGGHGWIQDIIDTENGPQLLVTGLEADAADWPDREQADAAAAELTERGPLAWVTVESTALPPSAQATLGDL